jgi:hypothetical protein
MRQSTTKVIRVELVEGDQEFSYERPAVTNAKLGALILFTFGLVVAMYALTYASPYLATPLRKCRAQSPAHTWPEAASSSVFSSSTSSFSE